MMRPLVYIFSFLVLIGLGAWAYRENYATQAALRDVDRLQSDIAALRAALVVQRAEWAYLNRPDRLRELVTLNFDRLGLLPMQPTQFAEPRDIAYPAPDAGLAVAQQGGLNSAADPGAADPGAADLGAADLAGRSLASPGDLQVQP
jgi:hypothetical protein